MSFLFFRYRLFTVVLFFLAISATPSLSETPKFTQQTTIDHGLSQSTVSSIYQGRNGRLWFATGDGVSIFNGETFEYIYRSKTPGRGIQSNYISQIKEGPNGNIWVATQGGGVSVLSQSGEFLWGYKSSSSDALINDVYDFAWGHDGDTWVATSGGTIRLAPLAIVDGPLIRAFPQPVSNISARTIELLSSGELLIGTRTQGLLLFDPADEERVSFTSENSALSGSRIMDLFQDSFGNVWVGTEDGGLNHFDVETAIFSQPLDLPDSDIESIAQGPDGRLWFGSWSNGVFVYDPESGELENYRARSGQSQRLSSNSVISMHPGRTGYMWLGTYDGGVNRVGLYPDPFATYFADPTGKTGPETGVIWSFAEGVEGDLWIGSKGGLSRFWPTQQRFEPVDLGEGSKDVRAILQQDEALLLAVRRRGLLSYDWQTGELNDVEGTEGINLFDGVYIRLLLRDREQNIWVGTHSGVYRLTPQLEIDLHLDADTTAEVLPHNRVRSLYEDPEGLIWIGTSGGLSRFDPETQTLKNFSGPAFFDDNDVRAVWRHPSGELYVGTQAGFSILDGEMNLLRQVQRKDGMPNETLYSLLPDVSGNLWIMTNNGLVRYSSQDQALDVFRTRDGLQGAEFNFNAYAALSDGRIAVGGINGFSIFDPLALSLNTSSPIVSLRSNLGDQNPVAPSSIYFDATVSHFSEPSQNVLRWKLEPVDAQWRQASGASHSLVRENLPAGDYTLVYEGISAAGVTSDLERIEFTVVSPVHRRWYAFLAYACLIMGLLYCGIRWRTGRLERQNLALEALVSEKTAELSAANADLATAYAEKSKFYARAAHEIRTPVSLIKAPLQSIAESQTLTDKNRSLIALVNRAVNRLTRLTDEMAEVAENGHEVAITASSIDVPSFVEPVLGLYQESAEANGLTFDAEVSFDGAASLDTEAFELILHNLLSNAVKHASRGGEIKATISASDNAVKVNVANAGEFPENTVEALQEARSGTLPQRGAEIVAAMVQRINGHIQVERQPAKVVVEIPAHVGSAPSEPSDAPPANQSTSILIIEDDRELREYLSSALEEFGAIHSVASASAARRAIKKQVFHLVLCDVMLPDGNGFDLIQETKENPDTSNIPAIFLTALSDVASQKKGLEAWGDDYLTKPFDLDELKSKVRIRLRNIEAVRAHVRGQVATVPQEAPVSLAPADERLVTCIEEAIAGGLSEINFSIDGVAKHCAISKRGLQRKLDALYGLTFSDLLGQRRMEQASKLLRSGMSVKQVCNACGYSHSSSFSRRFKQHFGQLPSEYREAFQGSS
ncbi:helix-turn-helix domain-containing protein [Rhodobacteraceae bacterium 10Alg 79]|uniref:histidine kinase n=2 Tax=Rhodalgimonas zhirmunskyi TaxID=2964767 RepID=A0AAJ1X459_9RHOB|nr:helix-turn-helix domain-containing protein [Rhodoalgimonas zhirmunskyi]